jgi:hypothetical protein
MKGKGKMILLIIINALFITSASLTGYALYLLYTYEED